MTVAAAGGMVLRAVPAVLPLAGQAGRADRADPAVRVVQADLVRRVALAVRARIAIVGRVVTRVDAAGNAANPWRLRFPCL